MRVEIRNDSVVIDGYVNVVSRDSKPISSITGKYIEQVRPKTFQKALNKIDDLNVLLNHDKNRKISSLSDGTLEIFEDNIGLRAICTVSDEEVVQKARKGELRGWSFGFIDNKPVWENTEDMIKRRYLEDIDLTEISILDKNKTPAYIATSVETRNDNEIICEYRSEENHIVRVDLSEKKDRNINNKLIMKKKYITLKKELYKNG